MWFEVGFTISHIERDTYKRSEPHRSGGRHTFYYLDGKPKQIDL